jgi:hypothetical protein
VVEVVLAEVRGSTLAVVTVDEMVCSDVEL